MFHDQIEICMLKICTLCLCDVSFKSFSISFKGRFTQENKYRFHWDVFLANDPDIVFLQCSIVQNQHFIFRLKLG